MAEKWDSGRGRKVTVSPDGRFMTLSRRASVRKSAEHWSL